jgi:heme A synthase
MACPDLPTCLGQWVPPLSNGLVALHFAHRLLAVLATLAVLGLAVRLARPGVARHVRRAALAAAVLVAVQFALGVLSVTSLLAVVPVSLHTLGAASLLALLVLMATWGFLPPGDRAAERAALADAGAAR